MAVRPVEELLAEELLINFSSLNDFEFLGETVISKGLSSSKRLYCVAEFIIRVIKRTRGKFLI